MTSPDTARIAAITLTFLLAGTVKGVTGMGLPTVAMGVLGTLMLPAEAASLLILPSLVTNVWQLLAGPRLGALAKRFWLMMAGIVIGTVAAASFIAGSGGVWAVTGLGAALTLYAASGLLSWHFTVPPRHERRLSPVIGVVTGLVTGGTGVFVVPAVPYLQALDLKKKISSRPSAYHLRYRPWHWRSGLLAQARSQPPISPARCSPSSLPCSVCGPVNAYVATSAPRPSADGSLSACWRSVFNCCYGI
jgi:Sulfite exporter TauE/SafE